jgi:glycosyltransferase involved in cell wall biosynthesis
MKTLGIICRTLSTGGTERVIACLSHVWSKLEYRIIFITQKEPTNADFDHVCEKRYVLSGIDSDRQLQRILKENQVEIIIYNGGWNNKYFRTQLRDIRACGPKTIYINHTSQSNWTFFLQNIGDFFKNDVIQYLDRMVCVNPVQALFWHNQNVPVSYIPNPETFLSVSPVYNWKSKVVVWIGRPKDPGKRLEDAIKIFAEVKKKVPEAVLRVIGDIDVTLKQKYTLQAKRNGINDSVAFLGYCTDLSSHLSQATLHIMTSIVEVDPMVLKEVSAYGVPTVMFELPMCFEATMDNGVVQVQEGNLEGFAQEVSSLLLNRSYAEQLSDASLVWYRKRLCLDIKGQWKNLFDQLSGLKCYPKTEVFETIDMYRLLVREFCRSERFFVVSHFWKVQLFSSYIERWVFLKKLFRGKKTSPGY